MERVDKWHHLKGYTAVACAMLVNLMVGSYYCYSNINGYIAAYMRNQGETVSNKDTLAILPMWLIIKGLCSLVGVKLADKLGYRTVNWIAYTGFTLVNFASVYVKGFWAFMIVYGLGSGICIGVGYLPPLYIAWTYFPNKKSVVTGFVLFMTGMSASILSPLSTYIVNPKNVVDYENDLEVIERVPTLFRWYTLIFGCLTLIGCGLMPPAVMPKEEKTKKNGREKGEPLTEKEQLTAQEERIIALMERERMLSEFKTVLNENDAFLAAGLSSKRVTALVSKDEIAAQLRDSEFKRSLNIEIGSGSIRGKDKEILPFHRHKTTPLTFEQVRSIASDKIKLATVSIDLAETVCPSSSAALKSWTFWQLIIMSFCCSIYCYFLSGVWKEYFKKKFVMEDMLKSMMLSAAAISNSITRLLTGFLLVKVSFKVLYLINAVVVIACAMTIDFMVEEAWVGLAYLLAAFAGIGVDVVMFPTICTEVFGPKVGPQVYPYIYMSFSFSNLVQYVILKLLDDYQNMFAVFGVFTIIGLFICFCFNPKPSWTITEQKVAQKESADANLNRQKQNSSKSNRRK